MIVFFFKEEKKGKENSIFGGNLLYVMDLQSMPNMYFVSLPLIYKHWMTR